jgi:RNA polymerase sigma factor (sigma-70 family)
VEERRTRQNRISIALSERTIQRLNEFQKASRSGSVDDIVEKAVEAYLAQRRQSAHALDRLTPRQRQVLQLVVEGNKTKEIARTLNISVKTVEMHRTQLMEALDLHTIAALVRFAIRNGVITP